MEQQFPSHSPSNVADVIHSLYMQDVKEATLYSRDLGAKVKLTYKNSFIKMSPLLKSSLPTDFDYNSYWNDVIDMNFDLQRILKELN